jgi:methyltransferase (TIGR00027 family)
MSNLNEIPSDTGHYAASARPAHSNGLQIVPLKIDVGLYAASQRAAHQILDNNPKIFEDLLALRIIGAEAESKLRRSPAQFQNRVERTVRARQLVRYRYAEDELARSIQRGIRQYIILGAGLDTFAYRNCFPLLQVFEVDHPATQAWKRSCLERAAIPIPASVTFVSVDFERQMMIDALGQSGFKSNELTFISWLGVVRYLSPEAFISVLTSIVSSMRPGSEVVFDSGPAPSLLQRLREMPHRPIGNWTFKKNAFRPTYYDLASLKSDLKRIGFADVQLFGPTELNDRYCNGRTDGLRVPSNLYLVKARV